MERSDISCMAEFILSESEPSEGESKGPGPREGVWSAAT